MDAVSWLMAPGTCSRPRGFVCGVGCLVFSVCDDLPPNSQRCPIHRICLVRPCLCIYAVNAALKFAFGSEDHCNEQVTSRQRNEGALCAAVCGRSSCAAGGGARIHQVHPAEVVGRGANVALFS